MGRAILFGSLFSVLMASCATSSSEISVKNTCIGEVVNKEYLSGYMLNRPKVFVGEEWRLLVKIDNEIKQLRVDKKFWENTGIGQEIKVVCEKVGGRIIIRSIPPVEKGG